MKNQQKQQNGQPSQVVLDELNEQDLAAVAGGIMLPVQTGRVVTPANFQQLSRYPLGIGPAVQDVPKGSHW